MLNRKNPMCELGKSLLINIVKLFNSYELHYAIYFSILNWCKNIIIRISIRLYSIIKQESLAIFFNLTAQVRGYY